MAEGLSQVQRVAAYGVARDSDARVLLVRASPQSKVPGVWFLPGGGVEHGEHPEATVVREFDEETGLAVEPVRLLCVDSDVSTLMDAGEALHHVRLIYMGFRAHVVGQDPCSYEVWAVSWDFHFGPE